MRQEDSEFKASLGLNVHNQKFLHLVIPLVTLHAGVTLHTGRVVAFWEQRAGLGCITHVDTPWPCVTSAPFAQRHSLAGTRVCWSLCEGPKTGREGPKTGHISCLSSSAIKTKTKRAPVDTGPPSSIRPLQLFGPVSAKCVSPTHSRRPHPPAPEGLLNMESRAAWHQGA